MSSYLVPCRYTPHESARNIPSGTPSPSSAQTRRFDRLAVARDIKGGEPPREGLGDDQRRVVGCHDHAIREGQPVRDLARLAVGRDKRDLSRRLPACENVGEFSEVEVDRFT